MTMRVALRIEGDGRSAKQALDETARSLANLQKTSLTLPATTGGALSEVANKLGGTGTGSISGAARLSSHTLQQLSFQLNDIATGLISGQSPFTVMAQQGGQVYQVLSMQPGGVGGGLRALGSQLAALITPARLAGGALALLGIAGYAMYESWKKAELQLDAVAKQMGVTIMQAHALEAAAAFKGVKTDIFVEGMKGFAQQVYLAKNDMGGLAEVMRANGRTARDFNGYLEAAADLIRNAADEQKRYLLLQQMGLPATSEWVRLLSQGSEGLRKAREEAVKFGNAADERMIEAARRFDESWAKATKNVGLYFKREFVDLTNSLSQMGDAFTTMMLKFNAGLKGEMLRSGQRLRQDFSDFYEVTGADRLGTRITVKPTIDPNALKNQLSLEQQHISLLGELATVEEKVRAKEIEVNLARLAGVTVAKSQADAIRSITRVQAEGARLTERTQLGFADSVSQWKQAENEIQVLLQRRIITLKEIAELQQFYAKKIEETVKQAMIAKAALPGLMRLQMEAGNLRTQLDRFATDTASNVGNAFVDIITHAKSASEAFRNLGLQVVRSLTDMMLKMTVIQPLAASLQSVLGGFVGGPGGGLGGTKGGGGFADGGVFDHGKVLPFAHGAAFANGNITPFASGGIVDSPMLFPMAKGTGLMGEAGPEAIFPLTRRPDGKLGVSASVDNRGVSGSGSSTIHLNFTNNIDARGARQGVGQEIVQAFDQFTRSDAFTVRVWKAVSEGQRRNWPL